MAYTRSGNKQDKETVLEHNGRTPAVGNLTADEAVVLDIFAQSLCVPLHTIGLQDNLFDIGGHSLIATRIVVAIRRHFGVFFSMAAFYEDATVAGVVAHLVDCNPESSIPLVRLPALDLADTCVASDAQTRLWVEEQMYPGQSRYHAGFQRRLTGALNVDALRGAILALVERHEALRTVFEMKETTLMQRVKAMQDCSPVQVLDLQVLEPDCCLHYEFQLTCLRL